MFSRTCKFELDDNQYNELLEWYEQVISSKHNGTHYFGAIGGEISIEFTPTSIGNFIVARCCGEELDLSDV